MFPSLRALGTAAEARQDVAALRALAATAESVQQAVAGMRQVVEDACRAEVSGGTEKEQKPDEVMQCYGAV